MSKYYQTVIAPLAPNHDPRHVEAYMRLEHATLSHLTTHSATLEDVFVSMTGRHLRDA